MSHGETNLSKLFQSMNPVLQEKTYVFASTSKMDLIDAARLNPVLLFQEKEGISIVLEEESARNAGLDFQYESKMITLNVHSSLDAVGFLAQITRKLADHGISVNPVSAFYHDHLFVPEDKADLAIAALQEMTQ